MSYLKKLKKAGLIERIIQLEKRLEDAYEQSQSESYDQGFDYGYQKGKEDAFEYLPNYELSQYDNVLRFA